MAANHIAMVRSSARMANIRSHEAILRNDTMNLSDELDKSGDDLRSNNTNNDVEFLSDELSQMSVISIASNAISVDDRSKLERNNSLVPELMAKLRRIDTVSDIDDCVEADLSQRKTLDDLERNWIAISDQFHALMRHLDKSSKEVSLASENCLKSLVESIELTCDKVDGEMKALYQLITKCDELTTKLSIAGSFREEIKSLKKSVETLEVLYRNKPKPMPDSNLDRRPATSRNVIAHDSVPAR